MSETESGAKPSARRWWEIPSGRRPQEGRYSELLTGGHSRSRPERSLSVGVDTPDESSRWRAYLWPIVGSAIALAVLILLAVLAMVL
ncbi:MAG: hypothetical protein GEU83_14265 [Pseudonocardiaceae bacterium]|nr:hypothetical protein [Pseudonocardiaceae bacterium]